MTKNLSSRVTSWEVLPTAALHGKILEMQKNGEEIIDLTVGVSNLPIPKSGEQAAIQAITQNNVPYTAIGGSSDLKKALQEKLVRENNINVELDQIISTTGAKQAIFEALYTITNPEDEIALFSPNWPAYTQTMTMLKLNPVFFRLDEIPSLSSKKISPKLKVIIINNPHNPTGKVLTESELKQIAQFAKKNNLYIIADESYEKLVFDGQFSSFYTIDESIRENLITIFSVSQSFSMMGWRMGYAVASSQIISSMEAIQSSITAATSGVTQAAVAKILEDESEYIKSLQTEFKQRRDEMFQKLSQISWLKCDCPSGGPYFWCDISQLNSNSTEFTSQLLDQQKVAVMAGESFGSPGWIRVAFNIEPIEVLEKAVRKIARFGQTFSKTS